MVLKAAVLKLVAVIGYIGCEIGVAGRQISPGGRSISSPKLGGAEQELLAVLPSPSSTLPLGGGRPALVRSGPWL